MARFQEPTEGRLIISTIYSQIDAVADALSLLEKQFGRIECETSDQPYSGAAKYSEEMGERLMRRFFSFSRPVKRDVLPEIKAVCHKIEREFGDQVDDFTFRTVNIDPGILSASNLIMASNREYNHRVYLSRGVFADIQLIWAHGHFTRLAWTNPDFCEDEAVEFFERVRQSFDMLDESLTEALSV